MYPTSMCGKPHPTSFRTLAHSGRVCRLLSEPETGSFLPCSGDADIVADQPAGPVHAIFGGVPRPTPRGVLDSSPCAYLEAVSLVLALVAVLARSQDRPFAAIEEALALRELVQGQGLSQHELARRCGRDVSWVSRRLQLLSGLPDEALAAVRAGRLSSWAANRVVAPLARANSDHANRLLERLVNEPLWACAKRWSAAPVSLSRLRTKSARSARPNACGRGPRDNAPRTCGSSRASLADLCSARRICGPSPRG